MAWDKTLPDGEQNIALGDDVIRANNIALEAALDLEHGFLTGGDQSGRHAFVQDSSANIAVLADVVDGSIAFDNDTVDPTRPVLRVYDGADWRYVGAGDPAHPVAYTNSVGQWTKNQAVLWESVVPAAGTPDTLAIDLTGSGMKYATITGDTIIQDPVSGVSGHMQSVLLVVTNSGAGHVITFGTAYRGPNSISPIYSSADGDVNVFSLTVLAGGTVLVTTAMDVGAF